jgi:hypothetical protein
MPISFDRELVAARRAAQDRGVFRQVRIRACLAISLLCLAPSVFGQFEKPARLAAELAAQGVPIPQQAMEMTEDMIWSMTVDLTDDSGNRLGSGLLGTFYNVRNTAEKYADTVTYVLAPQGVLGKTSRVTVSCLADFHQVAPLTVELRAEGNARNVFPGSGEAQGLIAVLLPQDFRKCGYSLEGLIKSGDQPKLNAGMEVRIPRRETDAAKEGPAGSKRLELTGLQRPAFGGKEAWAVSARHRDQAGGMPVFIVGHELIYYTVSQLWLHAYHIELAGIITPSTVSATGLKGKDHRSVLGLISRPAIGAVARALHRELERSGWAFLD